MAQKKEKSFFVNLVAGAGAGFMESVICHPLDTVKTRMQLARQRGSSMGPFATAKRIVTNERFFALYKGITAVVTGIVPKMAIRFSSFETYKRWLADSNGHVGTGRTFVAGTLAGVTEAIVVVTPMDVIKIRLQAQRHSLADPHEIRKYRGFWHACVTIVREEGVTALYKGVVPTVLRQASNQAVNFTVYQEMKKHYLNHTGKKDLAPWESLLMGGISGGMGPLANNPIDTIKTRLQKQRIVPGEKPRYDGVTGTIKTMLAEEGVLSFYKGLSPRLMRIMPGQAITFMVYEFISKRIQPSAPSAVKDTVKEMQAAASAALQPKKEKLTECVRVVRLLCVCVRRALRCGALRRCGPSVAFIEYKE